MTIEQLELKRGKVIEFHCSFDGKERCSWRAFYLGGETACDVKSRFRSGFVVGQIFPDDKIVRIKRGVSIVRDL